MYIQDMPATYPYQIEMDISVLKGKGGGTGPAFRTDFTANNPWESGSTYLTANLCGSGALQIAKVVGGSFSHLTGSAIAVDSLTSTWKTKYNAAASGAAVSSRVTVIDYGTYFEVYLDYELAYTSSDDLTPFTGTGIGVRASSGSNTTKITNIDVSDANIKTVSTGAFATGASKANPANFSNTTATIARMSGGIKISFVGTRQLVGRIEIYFDTFEGQGARESDATMWRIDLDAANVCNVYHKNATQVTISGLSFSIASNTSSGWSGILYIPYAGFNLTSDDVVGFSFGQWNSSISDWDGWDFGGAFVAPENTSNYVRLDVDTTLFKATTNETQTSVTTVSTGAFATGSGKSGTANQNAFANTTATISRTSTGIKLVFKGTRQLVGNIEVYFDTKTGYCDRASDTTMWRIDLNSDGSFDINQSNSTGVTIAGAYFIMSSNTSTGWSGTLFLPYAGFSLTADEVVGFSFGQWSTSANSGAGDWDGWNFNSAFVAPENTANYIRLGADTTLYKSSTNA